MRVRIAQLGEGIRELDLEPRMPLGAVLRQAGRDPSDLQGYQVRLAGAEVTDMERPVEPGANILLVPRVIGG